MSSVRSVFRTSREDVGRRIRGFLEQLLRPGQGESQEDVWRQLAGDIGGDFHKGGMLTLPVVQARTDDWTITLATTVHGHHTSTTVRAPFLNQEGLWFDIRRARSLSDLRKWLGSRDIEVGHPGFDKDFVIKGNPPGRVRRLFAGERIRKLIDAQPEIRLSVKGWGAWSAGPPSFDSPRFDVLHFTASGTIKDLVRLRQLFELFPAILQEVCHEGRAIAEDDVRTHIRRLRTPLVRVEDKFLLWDNREARRSAADALGRLGDPEGVPVLASVLGDEDGAVRALAVDALVRIGDPSAVAPLIPWLSDQRRADGGPFADRVAAGLRQLGEADLVDAVLAALGGEFQALNAQSSQHRDEIVEALVGALGGPFRFDRPAVASRSAAAAASALGEINATEALPDLRNVLRGVGPRSVVGAAASRAIAKLDAQAALPRPASTSDVAPDTLPRAASGTDVGRDQLPRPASQAEVGRDQHPKPARTGRSR